MRRRTDRRRGTSTVEFVVGLCAMMPLLLYGLNLFAIALAVPLLDSVAASCARTASNGSPADVSNVHADRTVLKTELPYLRASTSLKSAKLPVFVAVSPSIKMKESIRAPLPQSTLGGPVSGSVTIELDSKIKLPCPLPFMPEAISVQSKRTLPYTWTMPTQVH